MAVAENHIIMLDFKFDISLGHGHWLQWTEFQGVRCGGVIRHLDSKAESGLCAGSFWTDDRYNKACGTKHAIWMLTGAADAPTLSPSFMCHCGDHGWVRDGKWVPA